MVLLNYKPSASKTDPVVQECRGLVLVRREISSRDIASGTGAAVKWNVVCRPFARFFNWREVPDSGFDWDNFTVRVIE